VTPQTDTALTPQTGVATPSQDFRSADARDAGTKAINQTRGLLTWPLDSRSAALIARSPAPEPIAPAPVNAAPLPEGDDTSPLVYILPGVIVSVLLAAGMGYAVRTSGRAQRARHRRLTARCAQR
jgi:hypothetical protein